MSKITAGVTTPTALTLTGDTTGEITFEVSGTVTAATISSSGNVGIGTASAGTKLNVIGTGLFGTGTSPYFNPFTATTSALQSISTGVNAGSVVSMEFSASGGAGPGFFAGRSASGTIGTQTAVTSGLNIGTFGAYGSDGTSFIQCAQIVAQAASTYTTNNCPTNLLFYTNGGAASTTERMRIDSSGNVGIGTTTAAAGGLLTLNKAPAAAFGSPLLQVGGSSFTSGGYYSIGLGFTDAAYTEPPGEIAFVTTSDSGGTLGSIVFGTRSVTTNTAVSERMRIDSSGNVGIGTTTFGNRKLETGGTLPSSGGYSYAVLGAGTFPSGATTEANCFASFPSTQAASFTITNLVHYNTFQNTIGAGSTVSNQYGFLAGSSLTGATNNYGFYSNIASAANRWNFYAGGTAANYFAGNTGIGAAPSSTVRFDVTAATSSSGDYCVAFRNSSTTSLFYIENHGTLSTGTAANSPYNLTTGSGANVYVDSSGFLYRSTSSLRYKSDVTESAHGLADVLKLRSVTYKAKNDGDTIFGGLIAEEVHDAGLTEFVAYDNEGRPDALHYGNMVALAFKAIQELKAENDALKARLDALEAQ